MEHVVVPLPTELASMEETKIFPIKIPNLELYKQTYDQRLLRKTYLKFPFTLFTFGFSSGTSTLGFFSPVGFFLLSMAVRFLVEKADKI